MSKTIVSAQTALNTHQTRLTTYMRIVRVDGTTTGITEHDEDQTINSVVYSALGGVASSSYSSNIDRNAGSIDVAFALLAAGISKDDLLSGLYDGARAYLFETNPDSPVEDDIPLATGEFGQAKMEQGEVTLEVTGLLEYLTQNIGRSYKASCDADLGNTADKDGRVRCGVNLNPDQWAVTSPLTVWTAKTARDAKTGDIVRPTTENGYFYICTTGGTQGTSEPTWDTTPEDLTTSPVTAAGTTTDGSAVFTTIRAYTLTGTVTGVTDKFTFTDSSRSEPAEWWKNGKITWNTGNNAGFSQDIKDFKYVGSPQVLTFVLAESMYYDIQVGDTYTVVAGCQKRRTEDCKNKFFNGLNYQGFPDVPTEFSAQKRGTSR